ncbi:cytochrome b561 [Chromobacterium alkanivorans]|uniref:cytochrome b n=1 Tax=Chromobacterium alkanivorans TaxID=1071719 RepID=UPI00216885C5|nr:cytochrome b [Chromobacterium alkanivorans]MCS3804888.1 cytochrome b561 [Chromobacterium alkanivorans]MCS3819549.1 cytochrome b561 [Chromobacterium alkanivorans]MCS3874061.1 cytochrome b561 [Chromobacterium alkanivorans]
MSPSAPAAANAGYPRLQILFHWLSVLLMAVLALAGGLRHQLVSHAAVDMRSVMIVHIGCGMALLFLTLLRAATRLAGPALPPLAGSSRAQRACAHAAHLAIYGLILGSCLLGWLIVNAKGMAIPMPLLGFDFPRLVAADPALVIAAVRLHDWLGWICYGLLAVHIAAAVWHHVALKDDTLRRMSWRRPETAAAGCHRCSPATEAQNENLAPADRLAS